MDVSTSRQCPRRSGAGGRRVYCSQASLQSAAIVSIRSYRSSKASAMGRSLAGSGTKPASTEAHSDASIPARRAASATEQPAARRVLPTHWPNNRPQTRRRTESRSSCPLDIILMYSLWAFLSSNWAGHADLNNIVSMCVHEARTKAPHYFADVAPYSREYNTFRQIVGKQAQGNTELEIEYEKILNRVKRTRESVIRMNDRHFTRP